ncbi:MAG: ZIP family metal transporter, partial [Actinomycetota bacterium]
MNAAWAWSLGSVGVVSLLSLSGGIALMFDEERFRRMLLILVSFAAGALLGDAFLHIIPELAEGGGIDRGLSLLILAGLGAFFVIEKILHWHHAHFRSEEVIHPVAVTNIIGDGLHNFIDGALIAGAFATNTNLGLATTVAVALHEIPQEIGDLGILVHAGLSRRRALMLNLTTALTAVLGAVLALLLADAVPNAERSLLA